MHELYGEGIDHEFDVINQWNGSGKDFPFEELIAKYKKLVVE